MKNNLLNYFFITIGSFILAIGVIGFLSPNQIATGGTAGLAIIFHEMFNISIGLLFALINIPLLFVGLKYVGKKFVLKTIMAIGLMMVFIDFFGEFLKIEAFTNDPILATLYGGVLIGIGLGFIFKGGGSAGGGTIIAKIASANSNLKPGNIILMLDGIVVLSAGIVFQSLELALWSLINIFATSKLIDIIITGRSNDKILHISSNKSLKELGTILHDQIGVTGTIVKGSDLSGQENKDIIFILVHRNRINIIKQEVTKFDKQAKIIVVEATEIMGQTVNK